MGRKSIKLNAGFFIAMFDDQRVGVLAIRYIYNYIYNYMTIQLMHDDWLMVIKPGDINNHWD